MVTLATFLQEHAPEIIERWTDEARKAASARGLTQPDLQNIVPHLLASLGQVRPEEMAATVREATERHLAARLRQGFMLPEIVDEFHLLGEYVAKVHARCAPDERPDIEQLTPLLFELSRAATRVTEMFTEHLLKDEQNEKRYLRLLAQIATEALQPSAPRFSDRLREALEVIMEALGAQTAALLLYEPETDRLVIAASAGTADEPLKEYARSLTPSSFAGLIASREEPTAVGNASTTELEVSDTLRRSGVRSLLGVRLSPRHSLLGVMYVGIEETRRFTAREVRRIEVLGEALTVHLDNARLYAALRDAIATLERERSLRERFVSILAHDLRGPMTAAKVSADILVRHPEHLDQRRELAIKIVRAIDRTDRMIRDLLDVSRIQAGKHLPLRLDRCDVVAVAREVVEELNALHGDGFVLRAPIDAVEGVWSYEELRRALWNLASNAVKYSVPDRPVTVTVERTDRGARLWVHNYGSYIPPEDRERLFEQFARARTAQLREQPGWGLGLTLVRGCVDAHGGRVEVESDREEGTTFVIDLPRDSRPFQPRADEERASDRPQHLLH